MVAIKGGVGVGKVVKRKKMTATHARVLEDNADAMKLGDAAIRLIGALDTIADDLYLFRRFSTRDVFALAALAGDAINRSPQDLALRCYQVADEMLKQREAKQDPL